ncbi:hypothetical protein ACFWMR_01835 [Amycolatopsis thailandensis]|uniref:hypothetical protein n=1 Tax=Amycolatopsis thailandensis TaxID=589330 RepID=UPI00364CFA5A
MTDPTPDPALDPEFPTEGPDDDTRPPVVLVPSPTRQPMPQIPPPPPEPTIAELAEADGEIQQSAIDGE